MNDKFIDEYDREAVNKKLMNSLKSEGYNDGVIAGKSIGEKNKQIEIAKKMLSKESEISFISECTGLTKEELEHLN